ncbi:MAG: hypothetical protein HYR98_01460 [Nitrospirae bacterium]|nr:hypothetical protein [Nitrospirota bacterium]
MLSRIEPVDRLRMGLGRQKVNGILDEDERLFVVSPTVIRRASKFRMV